MDKPRQSVTTRIRDAVAVLVMDNPPVNQMSQHFVDELRETLARALADPAVSAVVLTAQGRNFIAGADVGQLAGIKDRQEALALVADMRAWFDSMEQSAKPIIAAINGNCLGGGLELAMACHYRLAAPGVSLALPEVRMGVIPGTGGTQRLPRLIGLPNALDLMLSARFIKSEKAHSMGLVDELAPAEGLEDAAVAAAGRFLTRKLNVKSRQASRRFDRLPSVAEKKDIIAAARQNLAGQTQGRMAPGKVIDALEQGLGVDPAPGLLAEAELFADCVVSHESKNLIGLFLAERAAGRLPEIKDIAPARPAMIGLLGGGAMGSGIAHLALAAGLKAVLWEIDQPALERARAAIAKTFAFQLKKGLIKPAQLEAMFEKGLTLTTRLEDLAPVDLVIEAVLENMALKQDLWRRLEAVCRPEVVFGTNTSALPITEMASVLEDPGRMLGLHFFNPAERMPLLEIIRAARTSPQTLATGVALARQLKKVPVVVSDGPGFYVTRQLISLPTGAMYLLADGLEMRAIDQAMVEFGLPMGPFTLEDLTGLDIGYHVGQTFARELGPRYQPHPLVEDIHDLGDFGRKTGRGFYDYSNGKPTPNPRVLAVVERYQHARGVTPRAPQPGEIVESLMALAINEAALMMEQGICRRPADMDLAMVQGTGFPAHRGGVLRFADQWGLERVRERLVRLEQKFGPRFAPADLLKDLAQRGGSFYQN